MLIKSFIADEYLRKIGLQVYFVKSPNISSAMTERMTNIYRGFCGVMGQLIVSRQVSPQRLGVTDMSWFLATFKPVSSFYCPMIKLILYRLSAAYCLIIKLILNRLPAVYCPIIKLIFNCHRLAAIYCQIIELILNRLAAVFCIINKLISNRLVFSVQ